MSDPLTIWTLDWVPEGPRGYVRDLRLRWACEEAGLPYCVETIAFDDRETNHLAAQPFGQVPWLEDGDLRLFESGAGVLHVAQKSDALMPRDEVARAEVSQWVFAALNSIEVATMPWLVLKWGGEDRPAITGWMEKRLANIEAVLADREWLVGDSFTAADLIMADVLRVSQVRRHGERPASEAYVKRATERPAFRAAHKAQLDHFERADAARQPIPTSEETNDE